jgi:hypothetical protein
MLLGYIALEESVAGLTKVDAGIVVEEGDYMRKVKP